MKRGKIIIALSLLFMLGCGTKQVNNGNSQEPVSIENKADVGTSMTNESGSGEIADVKSDEKGDPLSDDNMIENNNEKSESTQDTGPAGTPEEIDNIGPGANNGTEAGQEPISNPGGDVITSEPIGESIGNVTGVVTNDKPDDVGSDTSSGKSPEADSIQSAVIKGVENAGIDRIADTLKEYNMPSFVAETAPDKTEIYTREWGEYNAEFRTDSAKNIYLGVVSAKGSDAIKFMNSIVETLNLTDKILSEVDFSESEVGQGQFNCFLSRRGDLYIMQIGSKSYADSIRE